MKTKIFKSKKFLVFLICAGHFVLAAFFLQYVGGRFGSLKKDIESLREEISLSAASASAAVVSQGANAPEVSQKVFVGKYEVKYVPRLEIQRLSCGYVAYWNNTIYYVGDFSPWGEIETVLADGVFVKHVTGFFVYVPEIPSFEVQSKPELKQVKL